MIIYALIFLYAVNFINQVKKEKVSMTSKLPFQPNCPVTVVIGLHEGYDFVNLEAAKKVYPDLDPNVNGQRFTWAMHDKVNGQPAMRFESWEAEAIFSR